MANQRELDLLVKITTQGAEALGQIQQQIQAIAATPFTFGGAIDSIKQLAAEFQKLNQTAEENAAAKEGAKVASETAKAAQQLAKATAEQEKVAALAQKTEAERLKVQKEAILIDQQTVKLETEKARSIQATANAEAAQSRAKAAAIRTERVENPPEKPERKGGEGGLFGSITGAIPEIALVSAAFNQVTESIGKVGEFGKRVFEGLLAQVVEIRQQTLGIAASIASQQSVSVGGQAINNPLEAIKATLPEVNKGIEKLKRDSLDTTSTTAELIPLYQAIAGKLAPLGINLEQAEKLTVRLSQAAAGLSIPYQQAEQEIRGIANGEITVYNQLAKGLGLSQARFTQLQAEGKLYDFILQRSEALAAGQKLQAEQLPGLLSSIKDSLELITQAAGTPILDAILPVVAQVLKYLKDNQTEFEAIGKSVAEFFVGVGEKLGEAASIIGDALKPLLAAFEENANTGAQAFADTLTTLANVAVVLATAISPGLSLLSMFVKFLADLQSSDLGRVVTQIGLLVAVLLPFAPALVAVIGAIGGFVGAIGGLIAAAPALAAAVPGIVASLGSVGAAALLAAAPLIALVAAAAALGIGIAAIKEGAENDALDTLDTQTQSIADDTDKYTKKLKELNEAQGKDGQLTAEQRKQKAGLEQQVKSLKLSIDEQIKSLKEQSGQTQDDAQKNRLQAQIDLLEKKRKLLDETNKTTFGDKALIDNGSINDQLDNQLKGGFNKLKNQDTAEEGAKLVTEITQKSLEAGRITRAQAEENLKIIQNNGGLEVKTRLDAQSALTKLIQDGGKEQLDAVKTHEAVIQDQIKAGTLSQIEGEKELTAAKLEESDKQIANTQRLLDRELQITGGKDSPRVTELRNQLQQQEADKTAITEKGNRDRAAAELTGADNELKILEGKRVSGKLSEEAFANESLAITRKRIDAELKELERERALLKPGDTAGQQDIDAKEAALNGKREAAEEQFQARKLAIVERAQKRAEDAVKLSEVQRDTVTDQLLARREIRQVEADLRGVESKKKAIQSEIELEKQRSAALEALPKLADPVKEEERQQKIRASRLKSAGLTDALVKNEIEQQQAVFRVVSERLDRQAQAAKNASEAQVQPLQAQLQLQDALSKSLDNQNKLLESRKGLQSALSGYLEGELGLLAKSAKSDDEKQKIAQLSAAAKFKALQQQQAIEAQSLEIQLKQNEAALAREKIQNRISKLQNAADIAQAQADLAKAKAKPDATPEEINAAKLNLEAKQLAGKGLDLQGELLQQQGQVNEVSAQNQRQVLALKQQGELDQGKQGLIDTLPEGAKQQAQQNLTQEILQRLGLGNAIGDTNTDLITNATLQQRGVGNFGLPGQFNPVAPAAPVFANNPALTKLLGEFDQLADGKGSGKKESQASDLETALKQQQATETQQRERQGDRALSQQQTEAEKQRQGVIKALEQKRTQLVLLQGEQGEALLAIEESLASGDGAGATSGTVKGRVAGQSQKELIQGVLAQFQDGAIPKSKDLDGVLDAFRKSTERKIVATLPANPFKEAETALKDSISEDEKQGRGKSDATADKREALDKLEKLRTQLVLLQGDQGKAILSLAGSSQQTAGATGKTAEKIDEVVKNTAEKASKVGLPLTSTQPSKNVPNNVVDDLKRNIRTYYNSLFNLNASQGGAIVPSLVQPQKAIAPLTGNGGSTQMLATLEKINKAIEGNQLRPVHATVHNSIAGPDAATVVDLATKRMTDKLIGVLEKA